MTTLFAIRGRESPKEEIKADVQNDSSNAWNWNTNSNNNNWNNSNNVLVLSDLYKGRVYIDKIEGDEHGKKGYGQTYTAQHVLRGLL